MAQMAEKMLLNEDNKSMIVQCATFSKILNPRNINKSISDIRIRIRFPFESSFWISASGCILTILPDIQPANRIVIISGCGYLKSNQKVLIYTNTHHKNKRQTLVLYSKKQNN